MHNPGNIDKNYPYPVIGNRDDFEYNNLFSLTMRYGARNGFYEFTGNLKFDSYHNDYENYVKEKKMQYVVLVHNAETFYREYHQGFEKEVRFNIPQENLRGTVRFTAFISVLKEVIDFSPINQNEEFYGNTKFDLLPGSIAGVSNTLKLHIDPNFKKQDKTNAKHIITFIPDPDNKTIFQVKNWASHQLQVGIPEKLYNTWANLNTDDNKYLYHCSIYLPVLTEVVWRVQSDDEENNQLNDYKWYIVIQQLIEKHNYPEELDAHIIAQKLMNGPFKPYLMRLDHLMETFISG